MRTWLRCALVLAVALGLVVPASAAHATFPGKNGRLAFGRSAGSDTIALWTANPDGSGQRRLTFAGSFEEPSWSAGGRRIVYLRGHSAYRANALGIMNPDGSNRRRVPFYASDELGSPSFSPGGRRIIVTRQVADRPTRVWTLRLDGTDRRLLVKDLPGDVYDGVFSPDGRLIAFSHRPPGADYSAIYTVRTDGTGLRRITPRGFRDHSPDWAPGSGRLVFTRTSRDFARTNLMIVNVGGANLHALTNAPRNVYAHDAAWSPDGRWIVYHRLTSRNSLRLIRPDGTDDHLVRLGGDSNLMPSWQAQPA